LLPVLHAAKRLGGVLLTIVLCSPAMADRMPAAVRIDAGANRHPISPLIYGVSQATAADLAALNAPLNRSGGNNMSTYSYANNALNLDRDWYFESHPQGNAPTAVGGDDFVRATQSAGALPMLTVPMIGWVAKLGPDRKILPSFSVAKYGPQCRVDPYRPDAGDGLRPDCKTPLAGNDPNDAYVSDTPDQEAVWIAHLVKSWGRADAGGVKYYAMDNEATLWSLNHRDIHPIGPHAGEYRDKVLEMSARIKSADPGARVFAPEEWGWDGFRYSGYDQQYDAAHGGGQHPDHAEEQGGMDYVPWLLTQWKAAGHPVDVLSVHYYPSGGEFSEADEDVSAPMQLRRNRSTRELWDPTYVSESWIAAPVELIGRLRKWTVDYYYRDTPIAITEYNWGAESHINGATAQADVEGIFGVCGLDMATRWTVPAATTPTFKAMQMYRNYDGHNGTFGETSIEAVAPDPDELSTFAALRQKDGAMTVMVISKVRVGTTPVTLSIAGFTAAGAAQVYRLDAANHIAELPRLAWADGVLQDIVPPQSITLYVLPGSAVQAVMPAAPIHPGCGIR
jgi:hypothetical protein